MPEVPKPQQGSQPAQGWGTHPKGWEPHPRWCTRVVYSEELFTFR